MATGNYTSRVPEWLERIESERIQELREILRKAGESGDDRYDANTVYNMSPDDLRKAANEYIDRDAVLAEIADVPGVDPDEVASDTEGKTPVEVWDYARDTIVKSEVAQQTSDDPEVTPVTVEDALLWYEAEIHATNREIVQDQLPDIDVSDMHDDEIADIVAEEATKAYLGGEDSPLDSETIIQHRRAELIGDLTNEQGYDREDVNDLTLPELVELHGRATETTETSSQTGTGDDPMNPNQPPAGSPPPTQYPNQAANDRLQERLDNGPRGTGGENNTTPDSSSNPDETSPGAGGTPSAGITPLPGTSGNPDSGGNEQSSGGSNQDDTQTQGGDSSGDDTSGPPAGSTHYGSSVTGANGEVLGGETGYRDADGNWYEADGSPMGGEKSERMEKRYQDGEVTEGSTVPDDSESSDSTDSTDSDTTDDDTSDDPPPDDGEDVEYTPSGETAANGPSPAYDEFMRHAAETKAILDEARAGSTVNPVREGQESFTGGTLPAGNSLVGTDGDTRLDGAAAVSGTVTVNPGPDYDNSQGAGTIDYGPDANVDHGDGLDEELPTDFGPDEDLSHLAGDATNGQVDEDPAVGVMPSGVVPADLTAGDEVSIAVDPALIVQPQLDEPVFHMAVEDPPQTSYGEDEEPEPAIDSQPEPASTSVAGSLDVFDLNLVDDDGAEESTEPAADESEDTEPLEPEPAVVNDEPGGKQADADETELTFISEPAPERTAEPEPAVEEEAAPETLYPVAELATPVDDIETHLELVEPLVLPDDEEDDDDEDDAATD